MKENWKYKKLFYVMLLITIISLGFTAVVVGKLVEDADTSEEKYWFFKESMQTGEEVTLFNAYVYSNAGGRLEFLHDNIVYTIDGYLSEKYEGVADVVVYGDKIARVCAKTEAISGVLHSYDEDSVAILREVTDVVTKPEGGGTIETTEDIKEVVKDANVQIYKWEDNKVTEADWNQVIVGTSKIQCVIEDGQVCAVVIEETLPSDVRVLIKNDSSIFYSQLYIKKLSDGELVDVIAQMEEDDLTTLEISDANGLALCDSKGNITSETYEGTFRIRKEADGLILVNQLPIETYVKYVLPSEMPTTFHEEALKAQAVCARTFAYAHIRNQTYAQYGANLDDSTSFQVYNKTGRYTETDAAVDATKGEIITQNDQIVTCYYFSTSAGMTNDMSVWGTKTPAYIYSCESEDTDSPFYRWTAYLDTTEVQESEYGALKSIKIIEKNASGYVTEVQMVYENSIITLTNENDIRKALGSYLQKTILNNGKERTDLSMIPSACFTVSVAENGQIVLEGGGFGHGIGMSQYGANQMAKQGIGYKDIILHYFCDVIVQTV